MSAAERQGNWTRVAVAERERVLGRMVRVHVDRYEVAASALVEALGPAAARVWTQSVMAELDRWPRR